ncbi:MAG: 50S ribosomal protein L10 [Candidatus Micrarchaeia archaeon]|jgi:large subunit ribosomal protein L10
MVLNKKQKELKVAELAKKIAGYKVVAVVSLQNLPSKHYNAIKKKVRGKAELVITRATLLKKALEKANKPAFDSLAKTIDESGSVAYLLSNEDPFKIAKMLRQSKAKAPAKTGMIANADIVVPGGETSLAPGPVLTELKAAKINAKIQGTKIVIASDATVAKKGEPIADAVAKILTKLGIEPFEIGMTMKSAYTDGLTYTAVVLDVDDKVYLESVVSAYQKAINLAVFAEIFNKESTPIILASAQAKALALQKVVEDKSPKADVAGAPATDATPAQ